MNQFQLNRRASSRITRGHRRAGAAHLLQRYRARSSLRPLAHAACARGAAGEGVICLFQHGGPSQMDLFDAKARADAWHGKPFPGRVEAHFDTQVKNLLGSPFRFHKRANAAMELFLNPAAHGRDR